VNYLVVAHQTLGRRELFERLALEAAADTSAAFTLLVPATDPSHLLVWEDGTAAEIAGRKAETAPALFAAAGLQLTRAVVGTGSLLQAIEDELTAHPDMYESVILSTLPPHVSRWLGVSAGSEVEERLGTRVIHVVPGDAYDSVLDLLDPDAGS
jgi:hypothetical protein